MYTKGDMVVYPLHGAGVIEGLEQHYIDGKACDYYILKIPIGNLKIMLPSDKVMLNNIRFIMPASDISKALKEVNEMPPENFEEKGNWNDRYKENLSKLKKGIFRDKLIIFRNLYIKENRKGLSFSEKKMLSNIKSILLSEIMLSHNINKDQAQQIFEEDFIKAK